LRAIRRLAEHGGGYQAGSSKTSDVGSGDRRDRRDTSLVSVQAAEELVVGWQRVEAGGREGRWHHAGMAMLTSSHGLGVKSLPSSRRTIDAEPNPHWDAASRVKGDVQRCAKRPFVVQVDLAISGRAKTMPERSDWRTSER
jgi:hypothetical protein